MQNLYKRLGTDPQVIKARLGHFPSSDPNAVVANIFAAQSVAQKDWGPLEVSVPLEIRLLAGLIIHGTAEMKGALTPRAGKPGDIPFFVIRQRTEAELRSLWPEGTDQTGNALLLNDSLTS